jgi:23S rRNA (pseudouridine1915-N3)-methyltransferase
MRIQVAAVGRGGSDPGQAVYDHFARRMTFPFALKEVTIKRALQVAQLKAAEAAALLEAIPAEATVIALDPHGKVMTSEAFADQLRMWQDKSVRDLCFVIGGADGLGEAVCKRADFVLSLGAMTWPHLLVRGMLAEQLYRAQSIIAGHPYHRA